MKKIKFKLLLLSFLTILSGCNKSDSNINPNTNVDYEFTITINGLSHKIKGNTIDGNPFSTDNFVKLNNSCYADFIGSGAIGMVILDLDDTTEFNYIGGKQISCSIQFGDFLTLGVNNAALRFYDTYWDNLTDSLGVSSIGFSSTKGGPLGSYNTRIFNIPITITDLGNAAIVNYNPNPNLMYKHTKTFKGNFNGTLYMLNKVTNITDIPINVSIDFKAVRRAY